MGWKRQKKVLVNTLPSVISAPPALRAQVPVTMLVCVFTLLLLPLGEPACVRREKTAQEDPHDPQVFVGEGDANSFLSRQLLLNRFDFELFVPGNLERECWEEVCNYEEAREVFENIPDTDNFWKAYTSNQNKQGRVDVTSLLVGLVTAGVVIVLVGILIWYLCQTKWKKNPNRSRSNRARPRRSNASLIMRRLEEVSLQPVHPRGSLPPDANDPRGLPSYEEAITRSGQHDAPPPPYPGSRTGTGRR